MRSLPDRLFRVGPIGGLCIAGAVLYAWWTTGLAPFTRTSTVAVAIPVGLVALIVLVHPGGPPGVALPVEGRPPGRARYPWALLAVAALSLEAVALVLGGRSATVPTLSTVVDHALGWRPVRFLLFCAWMGAGAYPAAAAVLRHRRRAA